MLQMQCLNFSPKFNHLQQQPGSSTSLIFQSPLTKIHGFVNTSPSPCKKYSIKCSSQSSFNQNKFTEGLIGNTNHKYSLNKSRIPLALQSDNDNTAAAKPAPSFLEIFQKKFNAINHLVRSYTWVSVIASITSASLLPIQSLSDLTPRFFLEIFKAIVPALLMGIHTVTLNQICDVEIDKINKPYLPLVSGDISMGIATAICIGSVLLSLTLGIMSGSPPFLGSLITCFVGACCYSLPFPFLRWKSHTFLAPLLITILMGSTLQFPFYMHIQQYVLGRPFVITRPLIITVAIMCTFAFVNALLKDLPDVEGDEKFGMKTLAVLLGKEKVLSLCVNILLLGYGGIIIAGASSTFMINKLVTIIGHSILGFILWYQSRKVDVDSFDSTFNFYMLIWKLSSVEYVLVQFLR